MRQSETNPETLKKIIILCPIPNSPTVAIFGTALLNKKNSNLPVIILGDFNLHSASSTVNNEFEMFIAECNLQQKKCSAVQ